MTEFWWRSWHGAPMDHKWPVIAVRAGVKIGIVSAIAWALLDYASQHEERGSIAGFDVEAYAIYSGFSESEINAVIQAMRDKQVVIDDRFASWDKRQPKSEREIQRVTEYRKQRKNANVTDCYAPLPDVTKNYIEEESDTESESKDSSSSSRAGAREPGEVEQPEAGAKPEPDPATGHGQNPPPPPPPEVPAGIYAPYEQVFVQETGLPPLSGGAPRWFAGLKQIAEEIKATPEQFRQAIQEQRASPTHYGLNSPASFVNATANVVARGGAATESARPRASPPPALDSAALAKEIIRKKREKENGNGSH